ncbi:MAG TPA: PEP-CTERM sorting domain-containing protein [Candidatus Methylacidiphilales bacterium]
MKNRGGILPLLVVAAALSALPLRADDIIDNLTHFNTGVGTPSAINSASGKAIGFKMDALSFELTSVSLRLSVYGSQATDVPIVQIWSATLSGSTYVPGAVVASFDNPTFTYLPNSVASPTTNAAFTNYTFSLSASNPTVTLSANTAYFLVVSGQLNVNGAAAYWGNGSPTVAPTGANAVLTNVVFGANANPATWNSSSSNYNWFEIDGTALAVPEPSTWAFLGLGGGIALLGLRSVRRRAEAGTGA